MPPPPEGAQLSDDGAYWWDGTHQVWQLVDETTPGGEDPAWGGGTSSGDGSSGQLSEDGQYRWDGGQWQPVDQGGASADGLVDLPADLVEELNNFAAYYPELTAMWAAGVGDAWLRDAGIEPPTENDVPVA